MNFIKNDELIQLAASICTVHNIDMIKKRDLFCFIIFLIGESQAGAVDYIDSEYIISASQEKLTKLVATSTSYQPGSFFLGDVYEVFRRRPDRENDSQIFKSNFLNRFKTSFERGDLNNASVVVEKAIISKDSVKTVHPRQSTVDSLSALYPVIDFISGSMSDEKRKLTSSKLANINRTLQLSATDPSLVGQASTMLSNFYEDVISDVKSMYNTMNK